jgi:hypothetical protein
MEKTCSRVPVDGNSPAISLFVLKMKMRRWRMTFVVDGALDHPFG